MHTTPTCPSIKFSLAVFLSSILSAFLTPKASWPRPLCFLCVTRAQRENARQLGSVSYKRGEGCKGVETPPPRDFRLTPIPPPLV